VRKAAKKLSKRRDCVMRKMRLLAVCIIFIIFGSVVNPVFADSGPKPTLEIVVENLNDSNYYLDLLGKEGEYGYFDATHGNEEYDNMHDQPIYKYDTDGWKAIHMRTWVLNGKLTGEPFETDKSGNVISMKHSFGYVGVPKEFKIIIQRSDGSLQISDIIHNNHFNSIVHYDMKQNKVLSVRGNILKKDIEFDSKFSRDYFVRVMLTLLIEILIAVPFFYKHLRRILIIAAINFLTQTLLTAGMTIDYPIIHLFPFNTGYYAVLVIGEILVFIAEYLLYLKLFGKSEKRKIAEYTVIANLASFIAGFIII
jgi:hypothetical protein